MHVTVFQETVSEEEDQVCKMSESNFLRTLELGIQFGKWILPRAQSFRSCGTVGDVGSTGKPLSLGPITTFGHLSCNTEQGTVPKCWKPSSPVVVSCPLHNQAPNPLRFSILATSGS